MPSATIEQIQRRFHARRKSKAPLESTRQVDRIAIDLPSAGRRLEEIACEIQVDIGIGGAGQAGERQNSEATRLPYRSPQIRHLIWTGGGFSTSLRSGRTVENDPDRFPN